MTYKKLSLLLALGLLMAPTMPHLANAQVMDDIFAMAGNKSKPVAETDKEVKAEAEAKAEVKKEAPKEEKAAEEKKLKKKAVTSEKKAEPKKVEPKEETKKTEKKKVSKKGKNTGVLDAMLKKERQTEPKMPDFSSFNRLYEEQHDIKIEAPSSKLRSIHEENIRAGIAMNADVIESFMEIDEDGDTKAKLVIRVPEYKFEELLTLLGTSPAKIIKHTMIAKDRTRDAQDSIEAADRAEEIKDKLSALLISKKVGVVETVAIEQEMAKAAKELNIHKAEKAYFEKIENTRLVTVTYVSPSVLTGIDLMPANEAMEKGKKLFVASLAQAIVFSAMILPWLPVIIIALFIFKWIFIPKAKKVETVVVNQPEKKAKKEKKKGGFFSRKKKKEEAEEEDEEDDDEFEWEGPVLRNEDPQMPSLEVPKE